MISILSGNQNEREINITPDQLVEVYNREKLIQNVVPHLSPEDREFLRSGITPEEEIQYFGMHQDDDITDIASQQY